VDDFWNGPSQDAVTISAKTEVTFFHLVHRRRAVRLGTGRVALEAQGRAEEEKEGGVEVSLNPLGLCCRS